MNEPLPVLSIGGTDPCGAFGLVADLKTFAAHNTHGMGVVTVVTAQNSHSWYGAQFMTADFVAQQLDAVFGDYGASAIKTGFLGRVDLIQTVVNKIIEYNIQNVVVDPVMVSGKSNAMFGPDVTEAYRELLWPLATVLTPNKGEAQLWLDWPVGEASDWQAGIKHFRTLCRPNQRIVLKGVPEQGQWGDWLIGGDGAAFIPSEKIETPNSAGTGDTLSAAIAANLGKGIELDQAIRQALLFTGQAIRAAADWRLASGRGPICNFISS